MSLCVVDHGQCCCQPEDGIECFGVVKLRRELAEAKAAFSQHSKSGGDFEALRAALLAYYEKEGDETTC